MDKFHFDRDTHTYYLNGNVIMSTTEMLKLIGIVDTSYYTDEARDRGTKVHLACQYIAEGDIDENSVDPKIKKYVDAYISFLRDSSFRPVECEKQIYSKVYRYGTTPDQIGMYGDDQAIVELKTGSMMKWTGLQLAFQAIAKFPNKYFDIKRFGLNLKKNGTYKVEEYTDGNDFVVCFGILAVLNWKKDN